MVTKVADYLEENANHLGVDLVDIHLVAMKDSRSINKKDRWTVSDSILDFSISIIEEQDLVILLQYDDHHFTVLKLITI